MNDIAKGEDFVEANSTYESILAIVYTKMELIGHPSYHRQCIATRQRKIDRLSGECRPNACINSSTMNAHVISIRTKTDENTVYESLQSLIDFRNASWPVFYDAMDRELYRFSYVARAVQTLAQKYGLDLQQFTNHSSFVILREDVYPRDCSNKFAVKRDENLDNNFLQFMHYHEDGSKLTDCEDWLVILGI